MPQSVRRWSPSSGEIIAAARGGNGIVVEGRDIGTVVAPDADLKVFLTASAMERARRRSAEAPPTCHATAADLARRDRLDSTRAADPLAQASDAVVLDSTELGIERSSPGWRNSCEGRHDARGMA